MGAREAYAQADSIQAENNGNEKQMQIGWEVGVACAAILADIRVSSTATKATDNAVCTQSLSLSIYISPVPPSITSILFRICPQPFPFSFSFRRCSLSLPSHPSSLCSFGALHLPLHHLPSTFQSLCFGERERGRERRERKRKVRKDGGTKRGKEREGDRDRARSDRVSERE